MLPGMSAKPSQNRALPLSGQGIWPARWPSRCVPRDTRSSKSSPTSRQRLCGGLEQLAREIGASAVAAAGTADSVRRRLVLRARCSYCRRGGIPRTVRRIGAAKWRCIPAALWPATNLPCCSGKEPLVASVHPLMTFVRGSRPSLVDVPFALEGGQKAVRAARAIVQDLRGHPSRSANSTRPPITPGECLPRRC